MPLDLQRQSDYWLARFPSSPDLNAPLLTAYEQASRQPYKQSHYFSGRFENIYIDAKQLPELEPLIAQLKQAAATILHCPASQLTEGYWFNEMAPGDITSLHSHDDYDELLSAVYYLNAPENSGQLVLHSKTSKSLINPVAGTAIFFDPALPHEVTKNESAEIRLSLGVNFGPCR